MEVLTRGMSRFICSNPVTCTFLLVLIIACVYCCWNYWKIVRRYAQFPSCRMEVEIIIKFISGFYPKGVLFTSVFFQDVLNVCRRFQNEGFCVIWFFRPYFFVFNKEFFRRLMMEPAAVDKIHLLSLLKDLMGDGLLTSNAELWKRDRKLLNPAFSTAALKKKILIINKIAADAMEKLEEIAEKPNSDTMKLLKSYTIHILIESVLGVKLCDGKYTLNTASYAEAIDNLSRYMIYRVVRPWLHWQFPQHFFSEGRNYLKLCQELRRFTEEILLDLKASALVEEQPEGNFEQKTIKSFARILIDQHLKDSTFSMKEIIDHVSTIIAAGYDTTAHSLQWILYVLGLHPEVQAKALSEIELLIDGHVTHDDLSELKYLDCIIKETMRLYPPLPFFGRRLGKDIDCGKWTVPKGTEVVFSIYLLHRNPDTFTNPEKFDPDRFLENPDIRPWMHVPFAEGYRSCIGKKFALMELKVFLVHILRRFEIKTLEKLEETDLDFTVVLETVKPVRLMFMPRKLQNFVL